MRNRLSGVCRIAGVLHAFLLLQSLACTGITANASTNQPSSIAMVEPLSWASLIVRGKIVVIDEESSTLRDWGIESLTNMEINVEQITLRVDDVLKGTYTSTELRIAAFATLHGANSAPYSVGQEVLAAVFFNTTASRYQLRNYLGLFVKSEELWSRPSAAEYGESSTMSFSEIRERIGQMSFDAVSKRAELVVVGEVRSMETSGVGTGLETTCWTLEVAEVVKGHTDGKLVEFCMPTKGAFPDWAVPVPRNLRQGDNLTVFLNRRSNDWIPFAGLNGMFKIVSDRVLYDGTVDVGLRWSDLRAVVQASHE